jgi:hypothetical protein
MLKKTIISLFFFTTVVSSGMPNLATTAEGVLKVPFAPGETIIYDIKKLAVKVGQAVMVFKGQVSWKGQETLLITLTSKGLIFFDDEKIYLDPRTFLPLCVERDLNIFGRKEQIVEHYGPGNGTVRIVKTVKGETTEQVIQKRHPLENVYGFIYRYRLQGAFTAGEQTAVHLPTADVDFIFRGFDTMALSGRQAEAYYVESLPKKYRVWFDTGPARVPLRIDGAVGFGKTAMVMKEYRI